MREIEAEPHAQAEEDNHYHNQRQVYQETDVWEDNRVQVTVNNPVGDKKRQVGAYNGYKYPQYIP
jgi:hypothetical protein